MLEIDTFPLRERKMARTKLAIIRAVVERLKTQNLGEIPVREICADLEISETTFFNYFPAKSDLLVYFTQLWGLEMGWHARDILEKDGALAAIHSIYEKTGARHDENSTMMSEIIAFQALSADTTRPDPVPAVERIIAFPDLPGIVDLTDDGLDVLLPWLVEEAVARGELPKQTDIGTLSLTLASLFFGAPLVIHRVSGLSLEQVYRKLLSSLFDEASRC